MKPYGLVAAASTASQMSTPNGRAQRASSLMRAMLTWRKVFSSSLVSSAVRGPETGTVRSTRCPLNSSTAASEAASMPETSLGVFSSVQRGLPGSIRSGL